MRAFRPKPFRPDSFKTKAATAEARDSLGLTEEQRQAMLADFRWRVVAFKEQWRCCRDGHCRRERHCLGPPFACNRQGWEPPFTDQQVRRLKRDVLRRPPRVPGSIVPPGSA